MARRDHLRLVQDSDAAIAAGLRALGRAIEMETHYQTDARAAWLRKPRPWWLQMIERACWWRRHPRANFYCWDDQPW